MKVALFLIVILFIGLNSFSQPKYGYVSALIEMNGNPHLYISKVVNVAKLNCNTIRKDDQYFNNNKVKFYEQCISIYFYNIIVSKYKYKKDYSSKDFTPEIVKKDFLGCPISNEKSCFYLNGKEAEKARQDEINSIYRIAKIKIIEVSD